MQKIWIDNLPPGWKAQKLKYLAQFISGYSFDSQTYSNDGVPIVRIGDIKENINFDELKKIPENIARSLYKFRISKNDILLALTGATIGKTAIYNSNQVALLNQRVAILRSNTINQNYLSYCIASPTLTESINYMCFGGAQDNIGKNEIGGTFIVFPDSHTQQNIISFLRNKISTIDQIIAKKKKLIGLLQEKRSAIITNAVTEGLDPNARMKPSGIDWIGNIPEDWIIEKIKHVSRDRRAKTSDLLDTHYVALENIESFTGKFISSSEKIVPESSVNIYKGGDVLFAKLRPYLAKVYLAKENGVSSSEFLVLSPCNKLFAGYLYYSLLNKELINAINNLTYGAKMPRANWELIGSIQIVFPDVKTQKQIVNYLNTKTSIIDNLIGLIKQQIEKLSEYRASLIYHTVTGKIEV